MLGVIPAFLVTLVLWALFLGCCAIGSASEQDSPIIYVALLVFGFAVLSTCWLALELLLFVIRMITAVIRDELDRRP